MDLLAVMGRGIYQVSRHQWRSTGLLEICGDRLQHLGVRLPVDDENPCSIVGGGNANVLAAVELFRREQPKVIVFAYGHRSQYLVEADGPSESEVMSDEFERRARRYGATPGLVRRFPRAVKMDAPSNSFQELRNVLDLALGLELQTVTIVTVAVHWQRTQLFLEAVLQERDEYRALQAEVQDAESVLLQRNYRLAPVLRQMRESKSYARNAAREAQGISDFLAGKYKPVSSI